MFSLILQIRQSAKFSENELWQINEGGPVYWITWNYRNCQYTDVIKFTDVMLSWKIFGVVWLNLYVFCSVTGY